jgi:hypothetical protein
MKYSLATLALVSVVYAAPFAGGSGSYGGDNHGEDGGDSYGAVPPAESVRCIPNFDTRSNHSNRA